MPQRARATCDLGNVVRLVPRSFHFALTSTTEDFPSLFSLCLFDFPNLCNWILESRLTLQMLVSH